VIRNNVSRRRGGIAVLAAFVLVLLLLMVAFAVDLGYLFTVRTELQAAADAGALAGSAELAASRSRATTVAKEFARRNADVPDEGVGVEFGHWDFSGRSFTPGVAPYDAMQVTVQKTDTPLFFGKMAGRSTQNVAGRATAAYRPRDIVLVLDFSGSMNAQGRIDELKDSVTLFIHTLQEIEAEDRVAFVRYSTWGEMAIPLTIDLDRVNGTAQKLKAEGWTNIGHGMELAREELASHARSHAEKMMIVMTDGKVNRPQGTDPKTYVTDEAARARDEGITAITISFGDDADRKLMQQVADITKGVHFNVPDNAVGYDDDLRAVFRKIAVNRPVILVQ
jgi:Mg-chelatase subunit ChlD